MNCSYSYTQQTHYTHTHTHVFKRRNKSIWFQTFQSQRDFNLKSNQIQFNRIKSNQYIEHHCFAWYSIDCLFWKWFALMHARVETLVSTLYWLRQSHSCFVSGMLICVFASKLFFSFVAFSFPLQTNVAYCFPFFFSSCIWNYCSLFTASHGMWVLHSSNSVLNG